MNGSSKIIDNLIRNVFSKARPGEMPVSEVASSKCGRMRRNCVESDQTAWENKSFELQTASQA
jgi:hypothetical protein